MTSKQSKNLALLAEWRRREGMSEEEIAEEMATRAAWLKDNPNPNDPAIPEDEIALKKLAAFRKTDKPKINAIEYFTNYTKDK